MDWLLSPIDPSRAHDVGEAISWHARSMVVAWGVLAPLAVIAARFFKILPGQDWPNELDSQVWWRSHWIGNVAVLVLSAAGVMYVMPISLSEISLHNALGLLLIAALIVQVLLGIFRGSKGGPTSLDRSGSPHGHHYDMSRRRRMFEAAHKTLGYTALLLGIVAILTGLWKANGPVWMWLLLTLWWTCLVVTYFVMQRRGMAIDTYQAIWGDDPSHPGNQLPYPGWGMRRPDRAQFERRENVRRDRRNRV